MPSMLQQVDLCASLKSFCWLQCQAFDAIARIGFDQASTAAAALHGHEAQQCIAIEQGLRPSPCCSMYSFGMGCEPGVVRL